MDIALPPKARDEVIAAGRAQPHHMFPEAGITLILEKPADIENAIDLLRLSYDVISERRKLFSTARTHTLDEQE